MIILRAAMPSSARRLVATSGEATLRDEAARTSDGPAATNRSE